MHHEYTELEEGTAASHQATSPTTTVKLPENAINEQWPSYDDPQSMVESWTRQSGSADASDSRAREADLKGRLETDKKWESPMWVRVVGIGFAFRVIAPFAILFVLGLLGWGCLFFESIFLLSGGPVQSFSSEVGHLRSNLQTAICQADRDLREADYDISSGKLSDSANYTDLKSANDHLDAARRELASTEVAIKDAKQKSAKLEGFLATKDSVGQQSLESEERQLNIEAQREVKAAATELDNLERTELRLKTELALAVSQPLSMARPDTELNTDSNDDPPARTEIGDGSLGPAGIGVTLNSGKVSHDNCLIVERVLPGSPAEAAGIVVGDAVLSVDGRDMHDHCAYDVASAGRGEAETPVQLTVRHADQRVMSVTMVRQPLVDP